jgi:hypothetical protein
VPEFQKFPPLASLLHLGNIMSEDRAKKRAERKRKRKSMWDVDEGGGAKKQFVGAVSGDRYALHLHPGLPLTPLLPDASTLGTFRTK